MERIQKLIANSGYCSRRKAEELIEGGLVRVNGKIVKLGDKATTEDKIEVKRNIISLEGKKYYYVLNKPKGILVTKNDPQSRKTIYGLESLKKLRGKIGVDLNYVGRLDGMSEGMLILTNDGEFLNKMTHPSHDVSKTYLVRVEPRLKEKDISKLERGVLVDDRPLVAKIGEQKNNEFEITIREGRNRIIRRVMEKLGYKIFMLKRIKIGNVELGNLWAGGIRELDREDIKKFLD